VARGKSETGAPDPAVAFSRRKCVTNYLAGVFRHRKPPEEILAEGFQNEKRPA